ncbi:bis(5'-nucleosyl)-tetraphosphatase (symmetrical) YqeK [Dethiothermospora halolimnae]|uniref:bis(5'-nucleosyl)-tetraphosphatase (symmetrical) YqeK n=1 Tax=Dethiothermospora halolimnae TaxID=3114390 RepID=UPI003CCC1CE3
MNVNIDHNKLKNYIGEERYLHSLRVEKVAKKLGEIKECDKDKVSIAAILHDCGKLKDKDLLLKMARDFDIIQDNVMKNNTALIHSYLGVELAKKFYGIIDRDVLNAIKYHTTGRPGMTNLEKIIYVADYIEPSREFKEANYARKMAFEDLDKALLYILNNTIKYLINKGLLIHKNTIATRNDLILKHGLKWSENDEEVFKDI